MRCLIDGRRNVERQLGSAVFPGQCIDPVQRSSPGSGLRAAVYIVLLARQPVGVVVQVLRHLAVARHVADLIIQLVDVVVEQYAGIALVQRCVLSHKAVHPQELLDVGVREIPCILGLCDHLIGFFVAVGLSDVPLRCTDTHDVVRVIEYVSQVVDVVFKALGDVIFRLVSPALLEEGIVLLVRLQVRCLAGDGRRQLHGSVVQPQHFKGLGECRPLAFRLEMRRVPLDKADGLVSVGYEERVDALVQLLVDVAVCLHGGLYRCAVGLCVGRQFLHGGQIGLVVQQVRVLLRGLVDTELLGGVLYARAVPHIFHRRSVLLGELGYSVLRGAVLHQLLHQLTLLAVQRPFLAGAVREGPHPVQHGIHPCDLPPIVLRHRVEKLIVDLLSMLRAPLCFAYASRCLQIPAQCAELLSDLSAALPAVRHAALVIGDIHTQ